MNKITLTLHCTAVFIVLLLSSCESLQEDISVVRKSEKIECKVLAEMPTFTSEPLTDTKSSIEAILRIKWSKGDKLSVINLTTGKKLGGYIESQSEGTQVIFLGVNLKGSLNVGDKLLFINESDSFTEDEADCSSTVIDFSSQKGDMNNVPYCIYATYTAEKNDAINISSSSLKLNFLSNYVQLAVSGLPAGAEISDFSINEICSKCEISVNDGIFTTTPIEDKIIFDSFISNSKGAQMRYFSSFQSDAKESARTMSASSGNKEYPGTWIKASLNKGTYYQSVAAGFMDNYIHFKDEAFKALCVENADVNGDGEVSYSEASALTEFLKWYTYDARMVVDATDLAYFTSLTKAPVFYYEGTANPPHTSLKSIIFPPSIKTIPNECCRGAGITYVSLPENLESIEKYAFDGVNITEISFPSSLKSIGKYAFESSKLQSITIPETVELIEYSAFASSSLSEIHLSPSTEIKDRAFSNCKQLIEVTIPEGTESLNALFDGCNNLEIVHLPSTLKYIDQSGSNISGAFSNCEKLVSIDLPNGLLKIGYKAFYGTNMIAIDIPSTVTEIGYESFSSSDLKSITLPSDLKIIGHGAFSRCKSLETIKIPDKVELIDEYAFYYSDHITSIDFGNSVITKIGDRAFGSCSSLSTISALPNTLKTLGTSVFQYTKISEIIIPDSIQDIGNYCFSYMSLLTKVTIGSGCLNMGGGLFQGSPNLTEVHIRATVPPTINQYTFSDMPDETKIYVPNGYKETFVSSSNYWANLADKIFEETIQ